MVHKANRFYILDFWSTWLDVKLHKSFITALTALGKISAQPHPTSYIQFLERENSDKNNTLPLGTDLFYNSMGLCRNFTQPRTSYITYMQQNCKFMTEKLRRIIS